MSIRSITVDEFHAEPYRLERNLHLAVRVKPGASACVVAYNGDVLRIDNAEGIQFDDRAAVAKYSEKGPKFCTCRNFQFAAQMFPETI